jgi:hypothetical protein
MKWMHERCIPLTRLAKIDSFRDESARVAASELRDKRIEEERVDIQHRFRCAAENLRKGPRRPK